jgi:hypothetical protein
MIAPKPMGTRARKSKAPSLLAIALLALASLNLRLRTAKLILTTSY